MHVLIAYATNSGSTFLVAEKIHAVLESLTHQVTVKEVKDVNPEDIRSFDLVIFGSPSWDREGKEGQPLFTFFDFFEKVKDVDWSGQKFAVFGLGDRNYMIFCWATNVIREFVEEHHGIVIGDSLKINQFYMNNQEKSYQAAEEWVREIVANVSQ